MGAREKASECLGQLGMLLGLVVGLVSGAWYAAGSSDYATQDEGMLLLPKAASAADIADVEEAERRAWQD
eukprot:COSAG02_NODE_60306_length_271_cov_1.488372_1_plen_69_part_01